MRALTRHERVSTILIVGAAVSCCSTTTQASGARASWLRQSLVRDNQQLLASDPTAAAGKFKRMARDCFAFYRGTSSLLRSEPSAFVSAAASRVALIGDPHLENVGTFERGGDLLLDFNDFDQAGYGPYVDDLRKLALSVWLTAYIARFSPKQEARVTLAVVGGYRSEMLRLTKGEPALSLRRDIVLGSTAEAALDHWDAAPSASNTVATVPKDRTVVAELLTRYPGSLLGNESLTPAMFRLKGFVHFRSGISSFGASRYRAVVEGPSPAPDDDWTIDFKESHGLPAARIVGLEREFHEYRDEDRWLGFATIGTLEFRARGVVPSQRRLDAGRIAKLVRKGTWTHEQLETLATDLGGLLARGHARALGKDGTPGLAAIQGAIGAEGGLERETLAFVTNHGPQTVADFEIFQNLVSRDGPLLGTRPANRSEPAK